MKTQEDIKRQIVILKRQNKILLMHIKGLQHYGLNDKITTKEQIKQCTKEYLQTKYFIGGLKWVLDK